MRIKHSVMQIKVIQRLETQEAIKDVISIINNLGADKDWVTASSIWAWCTNDTTDYVYMYKDFVMLLDGAIEQGLVTKRLNGYSDYGKPLAEYTTVKEHNLSVDDLVPNSWVLDIIRKNKVMTFKDIVACSGMSESYVRKDLEFLMDKGVVSKEVKLYQSRRQAIYTWL